MEAHTDRMESHGRGASKMHKLKHSFRVKRKDRNLESFPEVDDDDEMSSGSVHGGHKHHKKFSLECPPQIDFYRNTLVGGHKPSSRPTMMDLIEAPGDVEASMPDRHNIEVFQQNQFILDRAFSTADSFGGGGGGGDGALGRRRSGIFRSIKSIRDIFPHPKSLGRVSTEDPEIRHTPYNPRSKSPATLSVDSTQAPYAPPLPPLPVTAAAAAAQRRISSSGSSKPPSRRHSIINAAKQVANTAQKKFGWIEGVLIRCMASIFGVMLYLRISWVAGQCGLLLGSCIVLLATLITIVTALSTSAICTNGVVKGGGAYYLISRSLGPEFGGSIGVIFSIANAVGAAMYIVGFAETIRDILKSYDIQLIDGDLNDMRVIGIVACVFIIGIIIVGLSFESKMQIVLMVVLIVSVIDYFIGSFMTPTAEQAVRGITGYRLETVKENLYPSFRDGYNFFAVFSVYFPASTGIMAGANISGDLKDPQKAIPLGTLLAIFVTSLVYLLLLWASGSTNVRDADGVNLPQLLSDLGMNASSSIWLADPLALVPPSASLTDVDTSTSASLILAAANDADASTPSIAVMEVTTQFYYAHPACYQNSTCEYGLLNYFQIVKLGSAFGTLVTVGIATSTLSSALVSMVGAPKVFQAVCRDKLFPYVARFGKGHGPNDEPRAALILASAIAFGIILIGDLNAIAPIISNFFLCSYALINYACFDNSFADSPGFRPSFKFYNMWVSLAGSFMCVCVMFIISWTTALLTFFFFALIFVYLQHRKPDVNWGTSTQAHCYRNALQNVSKLERIDEHVKNYRPQVLLLTGNPAARAGLVRFAHSITKGASLLLCGYVVPYAPSKSVFTMMKTLQEQLRGWFRSHHFKAFPVSVANPNIRCGVQTLLQVSGIGKLRPNILLMGYKRFWAEPNCGMGSTIDGRANGGVETVKKLAELNDYFGLIQDAFVQNMSVGILRNGDTGFDITELLLEEAPPLMTVPTATTRSTSDEKDYLTVPEPQRSAELQFTNVPLNSSTRRTDSSSTLSSNVTTTTMAVESGVGSAATTIGATRMDRFRPTIVRNASLYQPTSRTNTEADNEPGDQKQRLSETSVAVVTRDTAHHHSASTNPFSSPQTPITPRHDTLRSISSTIGVGGGPLSPVSADEFNRFQRKIKGGVIDVWWLYDDGGLTLLIPYLLSQPKSFLENAKLRVFTLSTKGRKVQQEQHNMVALLNKFRINCAHVNVIADSNTKRPKTESLAHFDAIIKPFMYHHQAESGGVASAVPYGMVTAAELKANEMRTWRQLRLSEYLRKHSSNADLVVVTLPVPRSGSSSALYLSWLEVISQDLPPTLMLRGNQQSVLTFYS